jgi:hypothetical protein
MKPAVDSPFAPRGPGDQMAPTDRYVAFTAKERRLASLLMRARRGGMNCPAGKIRNTLYFRKRNRILDNHSVRLFCSECSRRTRTGRERIQRPNPAIGRESI